MSFRIRTAFKTIMIYRLQAIIFISLVFILHSGVWGQDSNETAFFETGTVRAPSVRGEINAYPVTSRTASGKIFIAWSLSGPNNNDGRIMGATSSDNGKTWSEGFLVLDIPKKFDGDPCVIIDGNRILVYASSVVPPNKIDKSDIWMAASADDGKTWSSPVEIKTPFNYFVGKRHIGLKLKDGTLVMPASYDLWAQAGGTPAKTEGEMDLKAGVMLSKDGMNWTPHVDLHLFVPKVSPFSTGGVVEPAIVELHNGDLYMLIRTGTERLYESRSRDGGKTWSKPVPSQLYGHNTPASLWRVDQNPKEIIAIWNNSPRNRYPLSVAISANGGKTWSKPKDVAKSDGLQISYPGITQDKEGNFLAVWQEQLPSGNGRAIRWARFNRTWVLSD
jgi:Neuraminidase (sialidase)